jgi:hypothetical protein
MPKTLVGKVQNKKFAYFWLLIGGSLGNIIFIMYSPSAWPIFLPTALLSVLVMAIVADSLKRPKIWLGLDIGLTIGLLSFFIPYFGSATREVTILLPAALIVFGCVLGICNW